MKQAHVVVSGFVQGVGFRQFVRKNAEKLGIKGWVQNVPDGKVEGLFQSSAGSDQEEKAKIEEVIRICRKGPFLSEVKNVSVVWETPTRFYSDFSVIKS